MKVIPLHKFNPKVKTGEECQLVGNEFENAGNFEGAIDAYKEMLRKGCNNELAYQRLMILFRRTSQPEKELAIINSAISDFKKVFSKRKFEHNKTVASISKKLTKALGLVDKKGEAIYYPQPLHGWIKRKELLVQRMKRKTN